MEARTLSVVVALLLTATTALAEPAKPASPPSREQIVETLAPFGFWFTTPEHGLVWRPSHAEVGVEFVPFVSGGKMVNGTFQSRWRWGRLVFEHGSWTADDKWGWMWIPPDTGDDHRIATDEPVDNLPPLLPSLKLRSIRYEEGTEFAYPLGVKYGRRFAKGTELRYPIGDVGSEPGEDVLVPEQWMNAPVLRFQSIPSPRPVPQPVRQAEPKPAKK
jgi:hypothetical protein